MQFRNEPQIKFPEDPIEAIHKKLDRFFWILFSVGFMFVVILMVMVITLLIDSFHFNSATYKEYTERTKNAPELKILLEENNQTQQELSAFKECLKSGSWNKCF